MKQFAKKSIILILEFQARLVLKRYKPKIVAVTGSVGKTSTKDAIFTALSTNHFVRKSEKSFNTEIGIPLTILGCPNGWGNVFIWSKNILEGFALLLLKNHYPKWLVLEVGTDKPGDIHHITSWLKPDIVVVTRLPQVPVHVEFFESPEAVIAEKKHLVHALKDDGILILNGDDDEVARLRSEVRCNVVTYGFSPHTTLVASNEQVQYQDGMPVGITFRVDYKGSSVPVTLRDVLGSQHVYPALAALAVGISQDLNLIAIGQALSQSSTAPGRMRMVPGVKKTVLIDDTYNSSPAALAEALETVKKINTPSRKIVVLGDMLELGSYSAGEHKKAGVHAAGVADILVTVGVRARGIAEGALGEAFPELYLFQYEDAETAGKELEQIIQEGDILLIKGSQSMRMEKVVLELMAEPQRRKELLVRQEREWLLR